MSVCRLTVLNMKVVPAALWKRLSLFHSTAFFLCWFYLCESVSGFCILFYGSICLFFQLYHTVWIAIALSVHFSRSVISNYLQPKGLQHTSLPCPSPTPQACSNSSPLSWWCHPTISSSVVPFSHAFNLSQHQGLFQWVGPSHRVATVLEFQRQHQSFQWIFRTDFL